MADFEEAPVSALQQVFGTVTVAGYWFHYAQAVVKRLTKIGLRDAYLGSQDVQKIVRYLLSLPVLPTGEIVQAVSNIHPEIADDGQHVEDLKKLVAYINKQWINKRSVGPERLSVRGRTNSVMESYRAALKRQMLVSYHNMFSSVYIGDHLYFEKSWRTKTPDR